jgi:hypothetical protein
MKYETTILMVTDYGKIDDKTTYGYMGVGSIKRWAGALSSRGTFDSENAPKKTFQLQEAHSAIKRIPFREALVEASEY